MHFGFDLCKKFEEKNKSSSEDIICVYHKPVRYELLCAGGGDVKKSESRFI